jgi:hypothetical protein
MINDEDFGRLKLKIHRFEGDIVEKYKSVISDHYPSVYNFLEHSTQSTEINKVLKYIVYMFDKNSPMMHYFNDVGRRMTECAKLAGFGRGLDPVDNSELYSLEYGKYRLVEGYDVKNAGEEDEEEVPIYSPWKYPMIDIVVDYCIEQNSKKWSMICQDEILFYQNMREILLPVTEFKDQKQKLDAVIVKSKIREENIKIDGQSDGMYGEVFGTNERVIEVARQRATTPERRKRNR